MSKQRAVRAVPPRTAGVPYGQLALQHMFDQHGRLIVEHNLVTVQALLILQSHEMMISWPWTATTRYQGQRTSLVLSPPRSMPFSDLGYPLCSLCRLGPEDPRGGSQGTRTELPHFDSCPNPGICFCCNRSRMRPARVLANSIHALDGLHILLCPNSTKTAQSIFAIAGGRDQL